MEFEREIVTSDVHGMIDLLRNLVEKVIRFNPEKDKLIVCGDMIDRGKHSKEVILYLDALRKQHPENVVLLMGNHELKAWESLKPITSMGTMGDMHLPLEWIMFDGGNETVENYADLEEMQRLLLPFIESLDIFHETDSHIFVHGGVPKGTVNIRDVPIKELLRNRKMDYDGDKIVACGHTVHSEVTDYGKVVCVDTGACFFGKLSAFDVINRQVYWVEDKIPQRVLSENR